jgi:hypothetical protein
MNIQNSTAYCVERDERRCRDRRVFSYTEILPNRRMYSDRRCRIPLYEVELADEEIASLLDPSDEL